jgi:hypothetical protein
MKVQLEEIWINKSNDTPILTFCRKLVEDGIHPDTVLEVYRGEVLAIKAVIGKAAKLTVNQHTTSFDKYTEFRGTSSSRIRV